MHYIFLGIVIEGYEKLIRNSRGMRRKKTMAKHIGIVACSAEGAALCYRTICTEAPAFLGEFNHPEVTMHTLPLARYMTAIYAGDWEEVGRLMQVSAAILDRAGAKFAIIPDNTIHQGLTLVRDRMPIPFLHIAEVVGAEARRRGFRKVGLTGTKYLTAGPVYRETLPAYGVACEIPDEDSCERIDAIIFQELVNGLFLEKSRRYFNEVFSKLSVRGCEAVILGCTEIPLLVDPDDCPLPLLDSTRLLARAAIEKSLGNERESR